jgi:hypothetical protein
MKTNNIMKKCKLSINIISLFIFLVACGDGSSNSQKAKPVKTKIVNDKGIENDYDNTIIESDDACGFPVKTRDSFVKYVAQEDLPATFENNEGVYLSFRSNGTMTGGGPEGEETIWEANWSFQPATPTGIIVFEITVEGNDKSYQMEGSYNVEIFPDDGAIIFNCVDFRTEAY